jgi:hypothetical protein
VCVCVYVVHSSVPFIKQNQIQKTAVKPTARCKCSNEYMLVLCCAPSLMCLAHTTPRPYPPTCTCCTCVCLQNGGSSGGSEGGLTRAASITRLRDQYDASHWRGPLEAWVASDASAVIEHTKRCVSDAQLLAAAAG